MNTKVFNLALMAVWLLVFVALLTRDMGWMPEGLHDKVSGPQTTLAMALAGVLAVWNLMRFWAAHQRDRPMQPSATAEAYRRKIRSITGEDPKVVNPEFVFDDPPADDARKSP
jgi:hypothetical protein